MFEYFMDMRKIFKLYLVVVVLILLSVLFFSSPSIAGIFDPTLSWQSVQTEHFKINYPKSIEQIAKQSAIILEEIYPEITKKWSFEPWGRTEVVLIDSHDDSNGIASVLPYNWMIIYAGPPDPESSLAHYDDWLRTLLTHEFTHIVQIDAYGGLWTPFRYLLGKTTAPSGLNPIWLREGLAQYDETIYTKAGRGRGTYSDMVVRSAVLEKKFPKIDQADGLGYRHPGSAAAYIYGVRFVHWLVDAYGEDNFLKWDKQIRSSLLLTMINHHAKRIYGKSVYDLWYEWYAFLKHRYLIQRDELSKNPISAYQTIIEQGKDEQLNAPTLSPDAKKLVYSVQTPHQSSEIRLYDFETKKIKMLKRGHKANYFSWSADGTQLLYSTMRRLKHRFVSDIYAIKFDGESHEIKRLTFGMRAKDPEFYHDTDHVLFVKSGAMIDRLAVFDRKTRKVTYLTSDEDYTQLAYPRLSPDGKYIVASKWQADKGWRIYRYNSDGKMPMALSSAKGRIIQSRPMWNADGQYIVFSSDQNGVNNLYRISYKGENEKALTNTLTGIFQPTRPYGSSIIGRRYHSGGYEIARWVMPKKSATPMLAQLHHNRSESRDAIIDYKQLTLSKQDQEKIDHVFEDTKSYRPFGKSLLLPRFIAPMFIFGDTMFMGLNTGGMDPLRWHTWIGGVQYRSDISHIGGSFQYTYSQFRPRFGFRVMDYAVDFGNRNFGGSTGIVHLYEHRRAATVFASQSFKGHGFTLSYFLEHHKVKNNLTAANRNLLNLGYFTGFRLRYGYNNARRYAASISSEKGRSIKLSTSISNEVFGSGARNEQIIFAGDWREYISLGHHYVVALRGAGGITWGDTLVQGTFGMGGDLGEGTLASSGSLHYFPLRGIPLSTFSATRAMLFSSEFRIPIVSPQRGLGTMPFFLKSVSAAVFADYGNAWYAHCSSTSGSCDRASDFFDHFLLSVGAELKGDFIVGHGLPIHGRLGYGIVVLNRDRVSALADPITGGNVKYGMLILSFGSSF